ncbi:unnamed protein product [Linum trigynum]|uniref:CCHC-type domain-containing protein n=1 Tax=Linum trigynum TaxID=586398 RepID=A0AAV2FMX5_9ROSI
MADAAPPIPSAGGEPKPPDPTLGIRRPPESSSSPDGKKERESQHPKKRVRSLNLIDETSEMDTGMALSNCCQDLGCSFPYPVVARRLNMLWAKTGIIQVTNRGYGYYFIRFTNKLDYEHALTGGPWMLGDHYITTRPWRKGFNPRTNTIQSTMVWIQLPDLPIELYHPEAVLRIASYAGKPIRVDRATESGARAKFARVCVEVDLTKPLLTQFKVAGVEYEFQYEGLTNVCFHCGKYGHPKTRCPSLHVEESTPTPMQADTNKKPTRDEPYGEWMLAKRRGRRPYERHHAAHENQNPPPRYEHERSQPEGSCFAVLVDEEEEIMGEKSQPDQNANQGGNENSQTRKRKVWVEKHNRQSPQVPTKDRERHNHVEGGSASAHGKVLKGKGNVEEVEIACAREQLKPKENTEFQAEKNASQFTSEREADIPVTTVQNDNLESIQIDEPPDPPGTLTGSSPLPIASESTLIQQGEITNGDLGRSATVVDATSQPTESLTGEALPRPN